MMNWDLLRVALVIRNAGSLHSAAEMLELDRSTVIRRLDALEAELGARLFARRSDGCVLTEAGETIIGTLEAIEAAVTTLENRAGGLDRAIDGNVTIALPPFLAESLVVPEIARLRETHPGLAITLVTGLELLNLARGEADIALRNRRPDHNTLVARRLADGAMAFYASAGYLAKRGVPEKGFSGHDAILPIEKAMSLPLFGDATAISRHANVVVRFSDIMTGLAAAQAGLGIALLPCAATIGRPGLVPVPPGVVSRPQTFLVTHKDLRNRTRVRVVMDFLVDCFKRHEAQIAGRDIDKQF